MTSRLEGPQVDQAQDVLRIIQDRGAEGATRAGPGDWPVAPDISP